MELQKLNSLLFAKNFLKMPKVGALFFGDRDLPELIKLFVNGKKTLDYGCGPGKSSTLLKSIGLEVEGVDICNNMIMLAKEFDPSGKYYIIESARVAQKDEFYDFVCAGLVLHSISTKCEMLRVINEIKRILKPGGIFIGSVINEHAYKHKWLHIDADFEENKEPISGSVVRMDYKDHMFSIYLYYWTEEDYREVISKSGLDLIYIHKPLGKDTDGFRWITEKEEPIVNILIARKK